MSEAETKVLEAVEAVTESEELAAMSEERIADAVVERENAQAAQVVVAAAEAATALAQTTAAAAQQQAAITLSEKEGELEWLRQHATQTGNSLNEIQRNQTIMAESIAPIQTAMSSVMEVLQSLIQPSSTAEPGAPGIQVVNPVEENAAEDGLAAATPEQKRAALKTRKWV